jgi:hypothetical protein
VTARTAAAAAIEAALSACSMPWQRTGEWSYVVTLPGTQKQQTSVSLVVGEHAVRVEAFVMRAPDENREQLWAFLLQRNARLYGVAFAIDTAGDVYLVGRVGLAGLDAAEVDRRLGAVLDAADSSFNTMLEIGFGSAIRREWAWRSSRGEPVENLQAFRHLAPPGPDGASTPV